jgi:TolB-like protein/DNA-binding winged helix-turn-helix (wHTH) protein/Tfp pilus assembly protein PilF
MDLRDGFVLDGCEVRPREGRLVRAGESVRLRPKAMDVLCVLAEAGGQAVDRDTLLSRVWGRTAVSDEPLTSTIGELRRLLGERQGERRYIETIPKRGYRLLVEVTPLDDAVAEVDAAPPAAEAAMPDAARGAQALPAAAPASASTRLPPVSRRDWRGVVAFTLVLILALYAIDRLLLSPVVVPPQRSIAVLPFDNLSAQPEQDYFADGLSEELMSLLTRIPELRVAARGSSFAFRGQSLDTREVAERLQVAHLLTGSVRRLGNRVRVTAQLVDAGQGYQLWSATYDRTLDDIFAIQEEIATEVVAQLSLRLLDGAPRARETEPQAYTLYLQARHVAEQHTAAGMHQAVGLYRQALAIDPAYLPAWNELAGVYANLAGIGELERDEAFRLAREAAHRALAVDADYAPALDRLGWLALYQDNDLVEAARLYGRALRLEPNNATIRSNAAVLAIGLGRLPRAIEMLEDGARRDPISAIAHSNLASAYYLAGRLDAAAASLDKTLTLSPDYTGARYRLARIRLLQGDVAAAQTATESEPLPAGRLLGLALVHHALGDEDASESALQELLAMWGDRAAGNVAEAYAWRGEVDLAFHWLTRELQVNGASGFLEYRWNPMLEPLHRDPRWTGLLRRAGFDDVSLAAIDFPPD